jgi:hypothetical protein
VGTLSGRNTRYGDSVQSRKSIDLATFFSFEISMLADRFLMEIEENVNPGAEQRQFSKILFDYLNNMHSQIVAFDSNDL